MVESPGQGGGGEQGVEQREEHGELTRYQLPQLLFIAAAYVTAVLQYTPISKILNSLMRSIFKKLVSFFVLLYITSVLF